jgi:UDP-N-acetylmuramoylalanine--D-glutamate ligase
MIDWLKQKLGKQRIVILGLGLEGQSSLKFFQRNKIENQIVIADQNPDIQQNPIIDGLTIISGEHYLDQLKEEDFIIKSPGIPLKKYRPDLKSHSQTSLFLEFYSNQVIGVTGTKGKSTTSSMIFQILQDQNKASILVGNIGQPAFDLIEDISEDVLVVYELSAHQLQCVEKGPQMAILLNLMPEHLDFFGTTQKYYQAKLNIFKGQNQESFAFYHQNIEKIAGELPEKNILHTIISDTKLEIEEELFLEKEDLKYLVGSHHLDNIQAILELSFYLKLDINKTLERIKNFHPLPHRQEYLGEKNGVIFINDSISTIPQSAIHAIKAIDKVDYLILGGFDRGIDYSSLAEFMENQSFKKVFFLGQAGRSILREFRENEIHIYFKFHWAEKLQDIKEELLQIKSGTVLLSPAAASYDSFKNFEERGDYFRSIFEEIEG